MYRGLLKNNNINHYTTEATEQHHLIVSLNNIFKKKTHISCKTKA